MIKKKHLKVITDYVKTAKLAEVSGLEVQKIYNRQTRLKELSIEQSEALKKGLNKIIEELQQIIINSEIEA